MECPTSGHGPRGGLRPVPTYAGFVLSQNIPAAGLVGVDALAAVATAKRPARVADDVSAVAPAAGRGRAALADPDWIDPDGVGCVHAMNNAGTLSLMPRGGRSAAFELSRFLLRLNPEASTREEGEQVRLILLRSTPRSRIPGIGS